MAVIGEITALVEQVSVDEAFRRLRQEAHASRRKLTEVCAEVLEHR